MYIRDVSTNDATPTVVAIPCFSGAPWDFAPLSDLHGFPLRTMRLPEGVSTVDGYADFVAGQVKDLASYVLVGDSFGAVLGLALALRQPAGLRALVLSGGFAANPLPQWKSAMAGLAGFLPDAVYRNGVLRFHASQLASTFDTTAEVPQRKSDYRSLFLENTPRESYARRVSAVRKFDVRAQLGHVKVPTLVLTPQDDRLVGHGAVRDLVDGLPAAREVVLPETGHMFRFTHPHAYGNATARFLEEIMTETPAQA